jgi:hypothetical protein
MKLDWKKNWPGITILLVTIAYLIFKGISCGNDINVYLFASQQLFDKVNIYTGNPYNNYLYSPLFAYLLGPLSVLDFKLARVIWHLLNLVILYRLWIIVRSYLGRVTFMSEKAKKWWVFFVFLLSIGFVNHNIALGQVSFLILWLTIEGLRLIILDKRNTAGAALLALGINIKIIPLLAFFYLFFKKKYKAFAITSAFLILSLILPSVLIGHQYNMELLGHWKETISPTGEKYVFEDNDGCVALNGTLPAYFYDFEGDGIDKRAEKLGWKRKIAAVPENILVIVLQILRLLVVGVFLLAIIYVNRRKERNALWFYWEVCFFIQVSLLIFPHQMKYTMVYFVPVGAYVLLHLFRVFQQKWKVSIPEKIAAGFSMFTMFVFAIMGRDIIGSRAVDFIGFYQFIGISNLLFLWVLWVYKPSKLALSGGSLR